MNTYEKLEYYGRKRDWYSVGVDGFQEHEKRTRVICKRKEQKGFGEFVVGSPSEKIEIVLHNNSQYGMNVKEGKEDFQRIARIPSCRTAYNKLMWQAKHPNISKNSENTKNCKNCKMLNTTACNTCK